MCPLLCARRLVDWDGSVDFAVGHGIVVASKMMKEDAPTTPSLQGIDIRSGRRVWSSPDIGRAIAIFEPSEDTLFVFETTGAVHAMDIETGQKRWSLAQFISAPSEMFMNPYVTFLEGSRFVILTNPVTNTLTAVSAVLGTSCLSTALTPARPPVPPRPPQPPRAPPRPPAPASPPGCWSYSTWNIAWGDMTHAVDDAGVYISVSDACCLLLCVLPMPIRKPLRDKASRFMHGLCRTLRTFPAS